MNDRARLMALVGVPLLALVLFAALSMLVGQDNMQWAAGTFLASLDRVLGILVFLPRWASWAVVVFTLVAGARFLIWENQKVSEGQRTAVVVTGAVLLLLAAVVPVLLGAGRNPERGAWWRLESHREAGVERLFDGISFVWVAAGRFTSGSPDTEPGRNQDEIRREVVFSRGFWISRNEITVDMYKSVLGDSAKGLPGASDHPDLPVTGVGYEEALSFAQRLTDKGGGVYRLPTETEWEYACRAGSTTPWSFGADGAQLPEYAWFAENSEKRVHVVGTREANPWKIHDMHGNAAEWCAQADADDKEEPVFVYRGGDWESSASQCRSAARGIFVSGKTHLPATAGIRLVREP